MPSWDGMAFAVSEKTGVSSLAEVRDRKVPLTVSVRGNPAHATRYVVDEVLAAEGFSLKDIESWGGKLHYVDSPSQAERLEGMADGSVDAVFDEGIKSWGNIALNGGMRFLPLGEKASARLGELGWPVVAIPTDLFPKVTPGITGASFSGWPIFVRANMDDEVVYQMAKALDEAKGDIAFDTKEPVSLHDLCGDTDAAPIGIPLHPGAERYYHEQGALK
jgi:TRAP-type uncharacterized transport system substrate-binding protein